MKKTQPLKVNLGVSPIGSYYELPWKLWEKTRVGEEGIITSGGRVIDPRHLDLLLWKAAFYDRGYKPSGMCCPRCYLEGRANIDDCTDPSRPHDPALSLQVYSKQI